MNTHTDKTTETKSNAVANGVAVQQDAGLDTFQFEDNRPEAIAQRKIRDAANNSPQANQLESIKSLANSSTQVKQLRALQAMAYGNTSQLKEINEEETVQQKPETVQKKENKTGLPDNLKSGVEDLSGYSLDDVKVHYNSDKPAQLNALAYAQGTDIHVASGQERHLPHEAWHVVQQKQGRVQPTIQMKGEMNINDDINLEKEADVMGAKAVIHETSATDANLKQGTIALTDANNAMQPIQRLIGFEVEYQVPTYGSATEEVTLQNGENAANKMLKYFLFGGYAYGTELGGSAKPGDNSFRLTTDHKGAISREPIRAKLASMGKLDPVDKADRDASSNLEYVTSPVDELAKGSDKLLDTLIDKVSTHAISTFTVATGGVAGPIPAPAVNAATGTPLDKFKTWLSAEDYKKVVPELKAFWNNILDSTYIQATIGVMPSAVGALMAKTGDVNGVHKTGGARDQTYTAINTASQAVCTAVSTHKYITDLKKNKEVQTLFSVDGMVQLLIMFLVGEALSQTSAFPGGTIKNAVPFLIKIDPSKIANSGPTGMILFDAVPDDFVKKLAEQISAREEITVNYWRGKGYEALDRKKNWVTSGSVEDLTKMFLQGKSPAATEIQTGSTLKKLDSMNEISSGAGGQNGIPLEYRYVKAKPAAGGLKAELLKIVNEAREVNLSRVSAEDKIKIENQVKG